MGSTFLSGVNLLKHNSIISEFRNCMKYYANQYYHFFNRTNNQEALFRSRENYLFFLRKYRYYLENSFDTIAYCLMPTHFHFLVRVGDDAKDQKNEVVFEGVNSNKISEIIGIFLSSYTKAFNKTYSRSSSLFQRHAKAKLIDDESYFINLAFYIHQNPVRSGLVEKSEEWEFSSYKDYIDLRSGSLPVKSLLFSKFTANDIKEINDNKVFLPGNL